MEQTEPFKLEDHLEELRRRVLIVFLSIGVLALFSFLASDFLMVVIKLPVKQELPDLFFFTPYEAFTVKLKISLAGGILLSLPIVFYHLWRFVSPGLYVRERNVILPIAAVSSVLFAFGVLFAYFLVVPFAIKFFLTFETATLVPLISVNAYLSLFFSLLLTFGIIFVLPVVLIGLISFGILNTAFLRCQRKWIVVLIFVFAAVLTPTVDIITQCLLALPLWLLFEGSVWMGKKIETRRCG